MTEELEATLDQLEKEVLETIENPYSTYRVEFPYTCSWTRTAKVESYLLL